MNLTVSDNPVTHRNTKCACIVRRGPWAPEGTIEGISRCIAKLDDGGFWIIPNTSTSEHLCEDIGPYDTAEQAYAQLRLQAS
jgi:hypothetical protein